MVASVLSSLAKQGRLVWSLAAVILSGFIFATTVLLSAYSRGITIDLSLVRSWYLGGAILTLVGWAVLSFLSYFIALLMMHASKTSVDITPFLRVSGYAFVPFVFWSVPWVGWLIPLFGIALWILASKHGFECDLDRAVIISLPAIVAYFILAMAPPFRFFPPFGPLD